LILGNNAGTLKGLCVDADYVDEATHNTFMQLAKKGVSLYFNKNYRVIRNYNDDPDLINVKLAYSKYAHVHGTWEGLDTMKGVLHGATDFDFWIRQDSSAKYIYCAHPKAQDLTFPLEYGQALTDSNDVQERSITVSHNGKRIPVILKFRPYQSILVKIDNNDSIEFIDINFLPSTPRFEASDKTKKVPWRVYD
jgi:hypothetical protein